VTSPVRAVGYIRVSTAEQGVSGLGLEAQRRAIRAACKGRGWKLEAMHEDRGASARSMNRKGLQDALSAVESGEADVLVVSKLDRLSRSLVDFAGIMARSRRKGWALVALDLGVDTTTPSGELVASVMASVAQWERQVIGQRTREALAVKKAQGVRLGRPRTMPDAIVARINAMRADGMTLRQIGDALDTEGVPTAQGGARWYPATVRKVLMSTSTAA
jgi:DNA invertase Pin-like site-specific DNA recombinase